ncbi:MAG: hypothetical protein AMJ53_14360 [Gammaproteobacteria bacterium SG8_11]|nr:MAG: hypothetical protein AMJ53_14360 [Gammaproteobacteria bacterium SG8_11]
MDLTNKNFLRLDHRFFKAFMAAAETENFTQAAEKACMTQSGISQQIAKLEDQLGVPLFKRLGKNVILSPAGEKLVVYVRHYLENIESFFNDIQDKHQSMDGQVSYAMPPSCILSPHFPMLLERRLKFPELDLRVELRPNEEVFKWVLAGDVDFGFVTEKVANPLLSYLPFCQEEYILVSHNPDIAQGINETQLLTQNFVGYPGVGVYFDFWVDHFLPELDDTDFRSIRAASEINTIDGAILMVVGGLGMSIFPRHCVQQYIDNEKLFECPPGPNGPLLNDIYIVQLAKYQPPYRVEQVIQWFMEMKACTPDA